MRKAVASGVFALLLTLAAVQPVSATDGHFLHGVGAINASMGGAAVAAPRDLLSAFYANPAGLMGFDGTRFDLSMELFKPNRTVSSTIGPFSGSTQSKSEFVPIPAFAWSTEIADGKAVIGLGGLGIGGFGVDYPVDPTNPIMAPRPFGFGQVYSNFSLLKVAPAIAFSPTDKLSLGFAANIDWSTLSVDPMPAASPDGGFYPRATAADGAFGFGFQAGLTYRVKDGLSVGASYSSPQYFQDFEWNSVVADPTSPAFGTARTITFAMDVPQVIAGGVALEPTSNLFLAADVKAIFYAGTEGFDKSGFDQTGAVQGFGWSDIMVVAVGAEYSATDRVSLRGGYNFSENPIPEGNSMFNISAPAIVQHHATFGLGLMLNESLQVNAGYYHVFENELTGPVMMPGAPAGSTVSSKMFEDSFQIQFSYVGVN